MLDDEPDGIDTVFEDLEESNNKAQFFKETKLSPREYAWLALHINKQIEERRADAANLVESEVNVSALRPNLAYILTHLSSPWYRTVALAATFQTSESLSFEMLVLQQSMPLTGPLSLPCGMCFH